MNSIMMILFLIFLTAYLGKLVYLNKKKGIKAFILGRKKKDIETVVKISTFIWGITWFYYGLLGDIKWTVVSGIGITFIVIGLGLFIIAMLTMGNSWRVGVDEAVKTELVRKGLFKISRNPTFLGFDFMFLGLACVVFNIWTLAIIVVNMIGLHYLILKEERYLEVMNGESYREYKARVPRYIWFL